MHCHTFHFAAMASEHEIQLYSRTQAEAAHVAEVGINEVRRIEQTFSRYRDDSSISQINRAAGKHAVKIDVETSALLDYADQCFRNSDGLFDITSGVLRRCWNFREPRVPSADEINRVLPWIGWDKVERENSAIFLPLQGMEIDFGGIGKEYAADRAAAIMLNEGATHGFINLAGDIRVLGPHPNGDSWSIGIQHPRAIKKVVAGIKLKEGALATSGDYERYFDLDGKRYCHILNPKTGWPIVGAPQSVTIMAPLCIVAGSISTIALLKENGAVGFLTQSGLPYLLIDSDGGVTVSELQAITPDLQPR